MFYVLITYIINIILNITEANGELYICHVETYQIINLELKIKVRFKINYF